MTDVCEVCGNEMGVESLRCRFCGSQLDPVSGAKKTETLKHRIINIEIGKPRVEEAITKFELEFDRAKLEKVTVVTVIHGYGSSGRGGKIRQECRKMLQYLEDKKELKGFIPGENFSKKNGQTKALLRRMPQLSSNSNLNRANRGITVVEM